MTTIPSYDPCECCQTPDQCEIESLTADLELMHIEVARLNKAVAHRTEQRDTARRRIAQLQAANHHLKAELTAVLNNLEPPLADAAHKDRLFHQQWNRRIRTAAQTLGYTPDDLAAALFGENGR